METIEDYWTEEEKEKYDELVEENKVTELADFLVELTEKYDLPPHLKSSSNFNVVKEVRKERGKNLMEIIEDEKEFYGECPNCGEKMRWLCSECGYPYLHEGDD